MSDELRAAKGLLTAFTVDQLVTECLGVVKVLVIVGECRTGKTWATKDWIAGWRNAVEHVTYVDCQAIAFGRTAVIADGKKKCNLRENHYPRCALDGTDIVVVDEPQLNPVFVRELVARTSPAAGAAAHRLVVVLLQEQGLRPEMGLDAKNVRCFATTGRPVKLPKV